MTAPNVITVNDANFQSDVLNSDRPVLVDFFATWCGPCQAVAPVIEQIAQEHAETVQVGKLNIDESPQLAGRHGVQAVPTVVLFHQGQEVGRLVGVQPKRRYEELLQPYLAKK